MNTQFPVIFRAMATKFSDNMSYLCTHMRLILKLSLLPYIDKNWMYSVILRLMQLAKVCNIKLRIYITLNH